MIVSLRGNQRSLHTRQNLFCLRQRQPQIGDLGKAGGSIDLYQVDTICRDVGARFDQSQNPTHARSPGQKDKDKDRRIAPGPIPPISGQSPRRVAYCYLANARLLDSERGPLLAGEQPDEKDPRSDGEKVAQVADEGADRNDEAKAEGEQSRRNQSTSDDEQCHDAFSRSFLGVSSIGDPRARKSSFFRHRRTLRPRRASGPTTTARRRPEQFPERRQAPAKPPAAEQ